MKTLKGNACVSRAIQTETAHPSGKKQTVKYSFKSDAHSFDILPCRNELMRFSIRMSDFIEPYRAPVYSHRHDSLINTFDVPILNIP